MSRAGHDLQVGEVFARQLGDFEGLLGVVHRHDQDAGALGACDAQQIQPCGVAVEHAVAKGARHFQHVHAVV